MFRQVHYKFKNKSESYTQVRGIRDKFRICESPRSKRFPEVTTVKSLYSGHLRFLKKVSSRGKCPLYRVLNFLEEEIFNRQKSASKNSFHSNEFVGHVPLYWSELGNKFLKFPSHHIRVVVTGKRVNRRIGLGLERCQLITFFMETIALSNTFKNLET